VPEPRLEVSLRPAAASDTAQVLALSALIWEGDDYIPYVWEDWLKDAHGLLVVAEWQGRIAGLGKLTRLSVDNWWMEGLRTHPDFAGRGVASQTFHCLLETWQRTGSGTLRLATHSKNTPIHYICEREGLEWLGELVIYKAYPLAEPCQAFQPIAAAEIDSVLTSLKSSAAFGMNLGLLDLGWTWSAPAREIVRRTLEDGLGWRRLPSSGEREGKPHEHVFITVDPEAAEGPPQWVIQGLGCPEDQLTQLLHDLRCLAHMQGAGSVSWNLVPRPELTAAAGAAGYERAWDMSLYLYTTSKL
jgi:GNAT superfamily N-acetyltransferase